MAKLKTEGEIENGDELPQTARITGNSLLDHAFQMESVESLCGEQFQQIATGQRIGLIIHDFLSSTE